MSHFISQVKAGQEGRAKGIPLGKNLENISSDVNIFKGRIYGIAGAEKSGKTTFADYAFVIQPYLYSLEHGTDIEWRYYSFEIDRVSKEFDFATYFLYHDFGIETIKLPEGVTKNGKDTIPLSPDFLRGYVVDDKNKVILMSQDLMDKLRNVYENRIVPLFGEYSSEGILVKRGAMIFIENRINPTGIYKDILKFSNTIGTLNKNTKGELVSFSPTNPDKMVIVVVDHMRKLSIERGWTMKQTIDKMSEYMVILRNLLKFTFVPIIHTNRNLVSTDRLKFFKEDIYPSSDDIKDSANIGEDCNYLFTTFSPNDDKYNLDTHFGMKIRDSRGNRLFPNMKTIHLVSSRHGDFPRHYIVNMRGNLKSFAKFN